MINGLKKFRNKHKQTTTATEVERTIETTESEKKARTIIIPSDRLICEYLDESLLKKNGPGEVVWISNNQITRSTATNGPLELAICDDSLYVCGRLNISNSIRLFINEQHNQKGAEINF